MAERKTQQEFIDWVLDGRIHARRTSDGCISGGKRLVAKECYCGADNCFGWAMVRPDEEPVGNLPKPPKTDLKVVDLPKPSPGNGAREALIEYFDGKHYLRHVLTATDTKSQLIRAGADHILAWLWDKGFKVVPVGDG